MLSARLVQLIETHWEEIATRVTRAIKEHPEMRHLSRRPEGELREWCQQILSGLGTVLAAARKDEMKRRFELLGRMRYEENIPLHEAVLRFHLLKEQTTGFIHEQGFALNAVELYAEHELGQRINRFCDAAVYRVVRGYEEALRKAQRMAS